jgi:hypothetical protein
VRKQNERAIALLRISGGFPEKTLRKFGSED